MSKIRLQQAKKVLDLSNRGHNILDKKVFILRKETADLKERYARLKASIQNVSAESQAALQTANIAMGLNAVELITKALPQDDTIQILPGSIMGIEVLLISNTPTANPLLPTALQSAAANFTDLKNLLLLLAMVQVSIKKLTAAQRKTEIRVNALKNIVIPRQKQLVKQLTEKLEEQEREERSRL